MFERTAEGIENRRIFFGVDILVYCEGVPGRAFPVLDAIFWKIVFDECCNDTVRVQPSGSKSDVLKLFSSAGKDPHVYYAVDSDMEMISDRRFVPKLVKTFSYSFENDLCELPTLLAWLDRLPIGNDRGRLKAEIVSRHKQISRLMRRIGMLNFRMQKKTGKYVGKERSMDLVDLESGRLTTAYVQKWKSAGGGKASSRAEGTFVEWLSNCCSGEVGLRLMYAWFRQQLVDTKKYKLGSFENFVEALLAVRQDKIFAGECARQSYYKAQIHAS